MKRSTLVITALSFVALILVAGCGSGTTAKSSDGDKTPGSTTEATPKYAKPYPTITPESVNEKKAVAGTAQALEGYVLAANAGNQQNTPNTPVFDNKQGYKPRFVGYEFAVLGPKRSDGQYAMLNVCAFDGGRQIKPMTNWELYGSIAAGDGTMKDSWYEGFAGAADPASWITGLAPESSGEKDAQAAVEAWVKKNTKADSFNKVLLTNYLFVWGDVQVRPNMMMAVNPDGYSTGSVILWDEQK
jgi:hypothetical protein